MEKKKILVVDDDEIVILAYKRELEELGYDVITVMNGFDAVEIIKKEAIPLVFVDLILPRMNGVEICKKIKEISPSTQVVLVSGHPTEVREFQKDFLMSGGRDEILRKPLLEDELGHIAKKVFDEIEKK
ncbi:MAG: response regulator [Pseudomonadota bacterium]